MAFAGMLRRCVVCERRFASPSAFEKHLVGAVPADRRCLSIGELRAAGMATNRAGIWVTKRPRVAGVATGSYPARRWPQSAVQRSTEAVEPWTAAQRSTHYPRSGVPIDPRHVLGVAAHASRSQIEAAFESMSTEARANPAGWFQAIQRLRAARAALLDADGL
jgi:Zinc-finger of C2H2 type